MSVFEKEHKKIQGQNKEIRQEEHLKQLTLRASFLRSMKKAWIEFNAANSEDRTFELSKGSFKKLATLAKEKKMNPQILLKKLIEESSVQPSMNPENNIRKSKVTATARVTKYRTSKKKNIIAIFILLEKL